MLLESDNVIKIVLLKYDNVILKNVFVESDYVIIFFYLFFFVRLFVLNPLSR